MSTVLVVAPIVIANWSAITAAVAAGVATAGFTAAAATEEAIVQSQPGLTREEIEVPESEILADSHGGGERIVVQNGGIRAVFSRDARGGLKVCMEGQGVSKAELKRLGEELIGRVTQQYVYHRLVSELQSRNVTIVDEQVTKDNAVKIRVRSW
jgi:hypothetical protein